MQFSISNKLTKSQQWAAASELIAKFIHKFVIVSVLNNSGGFSNVPLEYTSAFMKNHQFIKIPDYYLSLNGYRDMFLPVFNYHMTKHFCIRWTAHA